METTIQLVVLAILVESVWESLKMVWEDDKFNIDAIGTLVLGVLIALVVRVDIFDVINISATTSIVRVVLTGILISRGGNFVHDLLKRLEG